jgi:integrase
LPGETGYTRRQVADLLGVTGRAIPPLVNRHRLAATGKGKARRYPPATVEYLLALHCKGASIRTSNSYLVALKAFLNWMVSDKRLGENPVDHLSIGNAKEDQRHKRQTLTEGQLRAILDAALASGHTFRGMAGRDRHAVYLVAMTTGLRAGEIGVLRPEWFLLDGELPRVVLPAEHAKNGHTAEQPFSSEAVSVLREYLADKTPGALVWPGTWHKKGAEMLRIDLNQAGIAYVVEGPDGPLFADFHSLRHSFIALLDKAGATLEEAMQLARHSDPKLTMAVYGRARLHDLGARVEQLPSLLSSDDDAPQAAEGA